MQKYKKHITIGLIVVFAAIFVVSAGILIDYFIDSKKQQGQFDELSQMVDKLQQEQQMPPQQDGDVSATPLPPYVEVTNQKTGKTIRVLREYAGIFELNNDLVGWLKIDGTGINYPVLQTGPETNDYYLKRDFYGNYSRHGCIFTEENADVNMPSDNVTIYGHKMADGTMFAPLHEFRSKSFYEAHPVIQFDTLTERHTYQICYVFIIAANAEMDFPYHRFISGTETEFNSFVANCKARSLYDTGAEIIYGDKLITLSTCDHNIDDGRLVVVARRIS